MNADPIPQQDVISRLGAKIPPGWLWKESLSLLAEDGSANVIFSSEPLDTDVTLDRYVEAQGGQLAEFEGYREIAVEETRTMGGRRGVLRRFEWSPPDGNPVTQIQIYCVENLRGYTATATTTTVGFKTVEPALVEILESLILDWSSAQLAETSLSAQAASAG